ncbi:hypothetical protein [Streptomyces sp. NPDC052496]|uniref:hypothetical protein n=1 Tax=Streptomyces sp. NPDC052496 TaxID=3154951 RepID=UPI0034258BC0
MMGWLTNLILQSLTTVLERFFRTVVDQALNPLLDLLRMRLTGRVGDAFAQVRVGRFVPRALSRRCRGRRGGRLSWTGGPQPARGVPQRQLRQERLIRQP